MYSRMFHMKFLPPGRGLWAMGTPITDQRRLFAALNNCAFVSTGPTAGADVTEPYCFLMDAAMLGVGVGFDTLGAGPWLCMRHMDGVCVHEMLRPFLADASCR
jgi:hypothetical protein